MDSKLHKVKAVCVVGCLAALAFVALPAGAQPTTLFEQVRERALADANGDLSKAMGTMTVYGPDGPVMRPITGNEWLDLVQYATRHVDQGVPAPVADANPGAAVTGVGVPFPASRLLLWPFCDTGSLFMLHASSDPSAITGSASVVPGGIPGPIVCFGGFGPANAWTQVRFNFAGKTPFGLGGCMAASIITSSTTPVGFTGGYNCGRFSLGCAQGVGVLTRLVFGTLALDYFLGDGDVAQLDNNPANLNC